jgi:hypothetical protein
MKIANNQDAAIAFLELISSGISRTTTPYQQTPIIPRKIGRWCWRGCARCLKVEKTASAVPQVIEESAREPDENNRRKSLA